MLCSLCVKIMCSMNVLTSGINYKDKTSYSSKILKDVWLINLSLVSFQKSYLKGFVPGEHMYYSLFPGICLSFKIWILHMIYGIYCAVDKILVNLEFWRIRNKLQGIFSAKWVSKNVQY